MCVCMCGQFKVYDSCQQLHPVYIIYISVTLGSYSGKG